MKSALFAAVALSSIPAFAQLLVHARNAANPTVQAGTPGALMSVYIESRIIPPGPVVLQPSTTTVTLNGTLLPTRGTDQRGGVTVLVPSNTPVGSAKLSVTYPLQGTIQTGTTTISMVGSSFGLFANGPGYGLALAIQGGKTVSLLNPAHPGDVVALWGTGLGTATMDQTTVLLGGHPAPILYAGPAPGLPGVDQINFQIPDDPLIPDACFVAIEVDLLKQRSNLLSLPKANAPGPCTPPLPWSADQLASLDAGSTLYYASFFLRSAVAPRDDGTFGRQDLFQAVSWPVTARVMATSPAFADDVAFSCAAHGYVASPLAADVTNYGTGPDLGPKMVLGGPSSSIEVPKLGSVYQLTPSTGLPGAGPDQVSASYFVPGAWQIAGDGNVSVSPYKIPFTLPPAIRITNSSSLQSVDLTKDLLISWDAAPFGPANTVTLRAFLDATTYSQTALCRARASDGQITLPANLLQLTAGDPGSTNAPIVSLYLALDGGVPLSIPMADGTMMPASLGYESTETIQVPVRQASNP
jgi:uncharacterized protein (TIGR03437 family)